MRVAVQMDALSSIDTRADSSWMMILEALRRGFEVHHYLPDDLSFDLKRGVQARTSCLRIDAAVLQGTPELSDLDQGMAKNRQLEDFDVVLMRQDPPFDMHYLSATYILERLPSSVLVMNNPCEVRNAPEKIFAMDFPDLMPPTLVSSDFETLAEFHRLHGDVIVKPLYGNGGAGIFRLRPDDQNFRSLFEMHRAHWRSPLQIQRFLSEIKLGDKRILLIDGEPVGAIDRFPAPSEVRANMHVGGTAVKTDLSTHDKEICAQIGPKLRELGMIFVGIDVIGGLMTEINVTSPTGIQEINHFNNVCIESILWDSLVRKIPQRAK